MLFYTRWTLACSVFLLCALSNADIYRWVDEQGRVHFGDRKKNDVKQELVDVNIASSEWKEFEIQVDIHDADLTLDEIAGIKEAVNWVYRFYDQYLYFDIYKTVPVNIRIEKDHASYAQYLAQHISSEYRHSRGVFIRNLNQIVVYLREDRAGTFRTIKHEVSHAIVDVLSEFTSRWMDEGLAEQMETLVQEEGVLKIYLHDENRACLAKASAQLMPLEDFLKLRSSEWKNDAMSLWQMQCFSGGLVYSLLSTTQGKPFVRKLLHYYSRGGRKISRYMVDDFYTGGLEVMTLHWQAWLKKQPDPSIEFKD